MRNEQEHIEQSALMDWASMFSGIAPELDFLFAIPNAQKMAGQTKQQKMFTIAKMKREGLKPGIPDLFLACPQESNGDTAPGLFIEMKVKPNTPSKEQLKWIYELQMQGYRCEICYSWVEAARVICDYLDLDFEKFGVQDDIIKPGN